MKINLIILLLFISIIKISAQTCVGIDPETGNIDLCQNVSFNKTGIYTHVKFGHVSFDESYTKVFTGGTGISYQIEWTKILVGISYNYMETSDYMLINGFYKYKYSLDLGAIVFLFPSKRLAIYCMNDFMNWHSEIGLAIVFDQLKNKW